LGLVNEDVLGAVARRVFGADASVLSSSLLAEGTGNLAHLLTLRGHDRRYVFRFNRGLREDTYDTEVATDKPVAEATGVRVPDLRHRPQLCRGTHRVHGDGVPHR